MDPEFGERIKVAYDSTSHHGGSKPAGSGSGKHVTAFIAASASGRVCPPFFIVQDKNVMSNWFQPLNSDLLRRVNGQSVVLPSSTWFPEDCVVFCTENGSMDINVLPIFVQHLNKFVLKVVPAEKSFLLTLDGHGSRKGVEWLELCIQYN